MNYAADIIQSVFSENFRAAVNLQRKQRQIKRQYMGN